jgi:hypothetical protein
LSKDVQSNYVRGRTILHHGHCSSLTDSNTIMLRTKKYF